MIKVEENSATKIYQGIVFSKSLKTDTNRIYSQKRKMESQTLFFY